jgi:hypothetical protein
MDWRKLTRGVNIFWYICQVMRRIIQYSAFVFLIFIAGCKNGADSIPELSTKIFKALQKQDQSLLSACEPSSSEMEKAYELYLSDPSATKEVRHQNSIDKTASIKLTLNQRFATMEQEAREKNINWTQARIIDFKYSLNDHKEDYKDASVRVILQTGAVKNVILYKAYLFGSRWYLMEGLAWEE